MFHLVEGGLPPRFEPNAFDSVDLQDADITITPSTPSIWRVTKIYHEELFVGYDLELVEGEFPVWGFLQNA